MLHIVVCRWILPGLCILGGASSGSDDDDVVVGAPALGSEWQQHFLDMYLHMIPNKLGLISLDSDSDSNSDTICIYIAQENHI
jgi:hypothetical protein